MKYKYEGIKVINEKFIGVYSSQQNAEKAKKRFKSKQGFRRFPENCFLISELILDENHWLDGFITLKKEIKKFDIAKKMGVRKTIKKFDEGIVKEVQENKKYIILNISKNGKVVIPTGLENIL